MHGYITAKPEFNLFLTRKTIEGLVRLAEAHPDPECRLAAINSGFLRAWMAISIYGIAEQGKVAVVATQKELGTCIKILGYRKSFYVQGSPELYDATTLYHVLHSAEFEAMGKLEGLRFNLMPPAL